MYKVQHSNYILLLLLLHRTQSTNKKHITQHQTTSNNKQRSQTLKKNYSTYTTNACSTITNIKK